MIKFLSDWVEQITIAVIIVSIFELILPNGKIKKYIKVVLGVYLIFSFISPFVDKNKLYNIQRDLQNNIEIIENNSILSTESKTVAESNTISQNKMNYRIEKIYIEQLKKEITSKIKDEGYVVSKCEVKVDDNKNTKIDLKIKKNTKKENLNETKAEKTEENTINIEKIEDVAKIEKIQIGGNIKEEEEKNKTEEENRIIEKIAAEYERSKDLINVKII